MMDFIRKYNQAQQQDILHTSAHAKVSQGGRIGAASTQAFSQRAHLDVGGGRTVVRQYRHSSLGARFGVSGAKRYTPTPTAQSGTSQPNRQQFNATGEVSSPVQPSRGFQEPKSRGYNPYA